MTLRYSIIDPLTIPDAAYNADDIATIIITGGSYGGMWSLYAKSTHEPPTSDTTIGHIETEDAPRQPDQAVEAVRAWVSEACTAAGVKLGHFKSLNDNYGPDEAPFFASALALIDRRP